MEELEMARTKIYDKAEDKIKRERADSVVWAEKEYKIIEGIIERQRARERFDNNNVA